MTLCREKKNYFDVSYVNNVGKLELMDEIFVLQQTGWGPVVPSSMEDIKLLNTHLPGGPLKKLMAVQKGLNFELRSETG